MAVELVHRELSESIIGGAMTVLNTLRPGLGEKTYERALLIELEERGHVVATQRAFPIAYKGRFVGRLVPDLIVDDSVIVDTKVVERFDASHVAQLIGYLAITGLQLALLLNFKHAKLDWKRIVNELAP